MRKTPILLAARLMGTMCAPLVAIGEGRSMSENDYIRSRFEELVGKGPRKKSFEELRRAYTLVIREYPKQDIPDVSQFVSLEKQCREFRFNTREAQVPKPELATFRPSLMAKFEGDMVFYETQKGKFLPAKSFGLVKGTNTVVLQPTGQPRAPLIYRRAPS